MLTATYLKVFSSFNQDFLYPLKKCQMFLFQGWIFFFDNYSLAVWWADETRPYIFFVYLHPTPPIKCKTHQIWTTLNWISGFFGFFFDFLSKKNKNSTKIVQTRPQDAEIGKLFPSGCGRILKNIHACD